ncbi:hypothetical protein BGZ65_000979, partial [Modicella reniformis]
MPLQQQYGAAPIQGQGQPAPPFQQDPRYAPYTPQLGQQLPPQQQPQSSSQPQFQQQQQQPYTFDQAYSNQMTPQAQPPVDYGINGTQQPQPFSPQPQQQPIQQQPVHVQAYQGFQQPVAGNEFA